MVALKLQQPSWICTAETFQPEKSKIVTIWTFTWNVYLLLICSQVTPKIYIIFIDLSSEISIYLSTEHLWLISTLILAVSKLDSKVPVPAIPNFIPSCPGMWQAYLPFPTFTPTADIANGSQHSFPLNPDGASESFLTLPSMKGWPETGSRRYKEGVGIENHLGSRISRLWRYWRGVCLVLSGLMVLSLVGRCYQSNGVSPWDEPYLLSL